MASKRKSNVFSDPMERNKGKGKASRFSFDDSLALQGMRRKAGARMKASARASLGARRVFAYGDFPLMGEFGFAWDPTRSVVGKVLGDV